MIKKSFIIVSLLFAINIKAQTPNFSEHVAPIIYSHCTSCHHPGAIGSPSLETYAEVFGAAAAINDAVTNKRMPPWPPDANYRPLTHQRVLSAVEIQTINDWVMSGSPQGNAALAPPVPVFGNESTITNPDLIIQIPTYTIQGSQDEFRCFALPSGLLNDYDITSYEVIPGNRSIVHHILMYYDTTGSCYANDVADPNAGYACYGGSDCSGTRLLAGWVPGSGAAIYPNGFGLKVESNGYFVIQIHYAPGSQGQSDSTKVLFKLSPISSAIRELAVTTLLYHYAPSLQNGPLVIPANTIKTFYEKLDVPFGLTFSLFNVAPHQHWVAVKSKVYALNSNGDTTRLINIPKWNFNWQGGYFFQKPIKITPGMTLWAESVYDNTTNNPMNPNNPPQTVSLGESTLDEMMLVYFTYCLYQPGDENIIMDSTLLISSVGKNNTNDLLMIYPNPATDNISIRLNDTKSVEEILIFDLNGRLIKKYSGNDIINDQSKFIQLKNLVLSDGVYLINIKSSKQFYSGKLNIVND